MKIVAIDGRKIEGLDLIECRLLRVRGRDACEYVKACIEKQEISCLQACGLRSGTLLFGVGVCFVGIKATGIDAEGVFIEVAFVVAGEVA